MVRVLHLRTSTGFWGPERQISQLIEPMRRHGFEIEVLVLYRHRPEQLQTHPLITAVRQRGARCEQINARWRDLPGNVINVVQRLRRNDFALVHTHEYRSNLIGGVAAKLVGVPAVASVRGYTDRTLPLRLYKYLDLLALRGFDRILPVADHIRRQLLMTGLSGQRVITLYDAIDPRSFRVDQSTDPACIRQKLGLNDRSKAISAVGRLSVEKGHRYLLESANRVLEHFPETRFWIIGDGPERKWLESLVTNLGLDDIVSFLGYRSEVASIMTASDVVVLTSLTEGCPNVLLEAMSLGKPVVATAVGGVPEIVRHEETGLLVPPKNPEAIAQALLRLLHNPAWAAHLGAQGRERALRHFHVDQLAQRLAQVYREVLQEHASTIRKTT